MKSSSFTIVTYWWGDDAKVCENTRTSYLNTADMGLTYKQLTDNLKARCDKLCLPLDCIKINVPDTPNGYQVGISYKPVFIEKMLRRWKRPVLYIDCDMLIHRYPRFIDLTDNQFDFMAFNWNADTRVHSNSVIMTTTRPDFDWHTLTSSGGLFYFNYTTNAIKLIKAWQRKMAMFSSKADDKILDICFQETKAKLWLKYYWFPMEYFYIPQYYSIIPLRKIVISHPYKLTQEDTCLINRFPSEYKKVVLNTITHYTHIIENLKNIKRQKLFLKCIKGRNKHFKRSGYIYSLQK